MSAEQEIGKTPEDKVHSVAVVAAEYQETIVFDAAFLHAGFRATEIALAAGRNQVSTADYMLAILDISKPNSPIHQLLEEKGINTQTLHVHLQEAVRSPQIEDGVTRNGTETTFTYSMNKLASIIARGNSQQNKPTVTPYIAFLSLFQLPDSAAMRAVKHIAPVPRPRLLQ